MARYYHSVSRWSEHPEEHTIVAAHDDKGQGIGHVPAGIVKTTHYPDRYTPNFTNTTERVLDVGHYPRGRDFKALANNTGFSVSYLNDLANDLADKRAPTFDETNRYANLAIASRMRSTVSLAEVPAESVFRKEARETNIRAARAISELKKDPGFGPDTLFEHKPESLRIRYASFHPDARALFPTAVALAAHLTGNPPIVADSDLSAQSSRLAQRAAKKGLVSAGKDNPTMEQTNDMPWYGVEADRRQLKALDDMRHFIRSPYGPIHLESEGFVGEYKRVPDTDVAQARKNVRQMLRDSRKAPEKMSPQFDHPMLPGFE